MITYSRKNLVKRLTNIRKRGQTIIAAGAGTGLSAKLIEQGGADLLLVFNSGRYRMDGHGSLSGLLAFGNANDIALDMGERQVLPVVKEIPVICSVNGTDPTKCMEYHLGEVVRRGFSGVNNFPTVGLIDGNFRQQLEQTNLGYNKEVEIVELAHKKDNFTIVYVFDTEEAKAMAKAGADAIVAHVGLTAGGTVGSKSALSMSESAALTREIITAAKRYNAEALFLAHGGPLSTPKDLAEFLKLLPSIDGFVGASSMERLPTERAIVETVQQFKKVAVQ